MPLATDNLVNWDVERVRKDFPILHTIAGEHPLVYLDNAATAQKPKAVINALSNYYEGTNANIHRGVHHLAEKATIAHDAARKAVASFINAPSPNCCVFVRGATEGINLVAAGLRESSLKVGDEIIITAMEHHANIVPWQLAIERTGATLKVCPILEDGSLDLDALDKLINDRTKVVAFTHVSNVLGTVLPAAEIIHKAKAVGAITLVDACQSVQHMPLDVLALDCDFLAFSGHKLFGPTGIGVLYGKEDMLNDLPPYQGGGDMIDQVSFEKTTFQKAPERFEAGTPHISGAIGLAAAIGYVNQLGLENINAYEHELFNYADQQMRTLEGMKIFGGAANRTGAISFKLGEIHPHDIGTFLDADGIAVRTGHHCCQPLMKILGVPATTRASFAFYNTHEEVDKLVKSLAKIQRLLG